MHTDFTGTYWYDKQNRGVQPSNVRHSLFKLADLTLLRKESKSLLTMKFITACALLAAAAFQDADAFSVVGKMKSLAKRSPAVNMPPLEAGGTGYPDKELNQMFANNIAWKKAQEAKDPEFFKKLGAVHKPNYFWIGTCRLKLCARGSI